MSLGKQLFRESALQQLQSPEQLDQVLQVTSPKGWLAIAAIWALLTVVVVWSIFGDVPSKERGQGIIIPRESIQQVQAGGSGQLDKYLVEVGEEVPAGANVARIRKDDLRDQIDKAKKERDGLCEQNTELAGLDDEEEYMDKTAAREEGLLLAELIKSIELQIERANERLGEMRNFLDKKDVNKFEVFAVEELVAARTTELAQAKLRSQTVQADLQRKNMARTTRRTARAIEERKLQLQIDLLESQFNRESNVTMESAGTVVEIRVAENTVVERGETLLLVQPELIEGDRDLLAGGEFTCPCDSEEFALLEAVVYLSAKTAKDDVKPGLEAHISPKTVKREEYGSIKGMVTWVAPYTTSVPAMMRELNDQNLVREFRESVGVPLEVRVALCKDEETVSGLEWTSEGGPPTEVSVGALCDASVTVENQRPIDLVIPKMKAALGAD